MKTTHLAALAATVLAVVPAAATAAPVYTYTGSGTGTTSVTYGNDRTATLNYSNDASFTPATFTLSGIATKTGSQLFNYTSSGFYAFFAVTASAAAFSGATTTQLYSAGPANCCLSPSNAFTYTGSVRLDLVQGTPFG